VLGLVRSMSVRPSPPCPNKEHEEEPLDLNVLLLLVCETLLIQ
jgi:hypothetical protein